MNMYVFYPNCHGPYTLFVMAESADLAAKAINDYRKKQSDSYTYGDNDISADDLTVYDEMQVAENPND